MVKNLPVSAGDARDTDSIPRSERSLGVGNGHLIQYFCLENSKDKEPGKLYVVHRVVQSPTQLNVHALHT